MDLKALQDLISLSETGSFTKAAEKRFVTQPAFSRRIKSLENWFGTALVDRSHYPTRLTQEGELVLKVASNIVEELYRCRQSIIAGNKDGSEYLRFAMPHSLSIGFFPRWCASIEDIIGSMSIDVVTGNIHDSAQLLESESCDFVLFYNCELVPSYCFNDSKFERIYIGSDTLIPVIKPGANGKSPIDLEIDGNVPIPYLSWSPPTLISQVLIELIQLHRLETRLNTRYQNQLAAAIREEALQGKGFAWLPQNLIGNDIENGKLVRVSQGHDVPIKIGLACSSTNRSEITSRWWEHVLTHGAP